MSSAGLNGIKPGRVSMFSWALGSSMAAIAGIFLAEELATLDVQTLTLLILAAFAAAIIGRLKSLPMTFAGGLLIGLVFMFQQNFLSWTGRWTTAPLAIPQIILFLALLFLPQARIEGEEGHPPGRARGSPSSRSAAFGHVHPVRRRVPDLADRRSGSATRQLTLAVAHHADHGVAGAADRLVEADLAGADHVRRCRRVRLPAVGTRPRQRRRHDRRRAVRRSRSVSRWRCPRCGSKACTWRWPPWRSREMAAILFFPQPEILGFDGKPIGPIEILGFDFSQPFDFLGIHFGQDVGTLFFITFALGVVGVLVVWLHKSRFGRRLTGARRQPRGVRDARHQPDRHQARSCS